jgi:hypothetical protein
LPLSVEFTSVRPAPLSTITVHRSGDSESR